MEKQFFKDPATYVGEVSINVTDLERSLTFYKTIVGFKVLEQTEQRAVLTADGKTPLLILERPADVVPKVGRTAGLYHFAILLPTRADLSAFLRHIIQMRVQLGAADHLVSEALYFSDPDGNGIEVYHDRPSSEWSWENGEVSMATEQLDGDSILAESAQEWNGLPEQTVMGHIHLHVSDLQKTEEFYINGLGFTVVTTYPGALFTSTGDYHHHIGLNVWNGVGAPMPTKNSVGLNYFTLVFPNEKSRTSAVERLRQIGANVTNEQDYYVTEDPSGNVIRMMMD
ncbi:VOC family protein [Lentibacillus sp. Marseille-P4043]|uniref:VOC family protein n=1 Tax=Lentibacillus sp. Marseille-P4043 TaxID=2040293 RepID=UPI000D0B91C8|nr:VOC family protein [Lentibacillus sp. Marseille-P4043]